MFQDCQLTLQVHYWPGCCGRRRGSASSETLFDVKHSIRYSEEKEKQTKSKTERRHRGTQRGTQNEREKIERGLHGSKTGEVYNEISLIFILNFYRTSKLWIGYSTAYMYMSSLTRISRKFCADLGCRQPQTFFHDRVDRVGRPLTSLPVLGTFGAAGRGRCAASRQDDFQTRLLNSSQLFTIDSNSIFD